ncbi:hypothetical protein JRQ81_009411 [Phrynocephalus forsythii]|uniref:Nuclear receptor subfamily 1 group I member 3 n=1 Tax=Phrynocephalus forsythii TaxID=171643 RepID=A0A9Q0XBS7_9SAUR|nr:hypothetical protein JRQ81_009411 [Phrynocephalus forsythii]
MAGPVTPCSLDGENSTLSSTALSLSDTDLVEEEEKICAVCGDRATGYHFHAMTCEGCKGFFRRTVLKGTRSTCAFTRSCAITKAKRRQCQACRYQKCLAVGMKKDMIMSEEALRARRELRRQKRHREPNPAAGSTQNGSLTADQQQLIDILSDAYKKNIDPSFFPFIVWRMSCSRPKGKGPGSAATAPHLLSPLFQSPGHNLHPQDPQDVPLGGPLCSQDPTERFPEEVFADAFSVLPMFADLTLMIQQVVQFAKAVPFFKSLPMEDQISLLKGAALEICGIQMNMGFDAENNIWACGPHYYSITQCTLAGFQQTHMELVQKFHVNLRKLNLHHTEYILLQALLLFSPDHVTIVQREAVDQTQERIALTLKSYIDHCHSLSEGRFLYAKLLLLLTELRSLKVEGTRQMLHIQDANGLGSKMPLLSEIIS